MRCSACELDCAECACDPPRAGEHGTAKWRRSKRLPPCRADATLTVALGSKRALLGLGDLLKHDELSKDIHKAVAVATSRFCDEHSLGTECLAKLEAALAAKVFMHSTTVRLDAPGGGTVRTWEPSAGSPWPTPI